MNAEILCVGTEILLGDIVNTNAAYIAKELALCGINCYYQTVVGDNPERLSNSLVLALSRADIVIMTGGLGPTYDDLTKETVAQYFGLEMEMHTPSLEKIRAFFKRIERPMTLNNEKQAMMPKGAIVLENDRGTAPGLAVQQIDSRTNTQKTVVLLPGPPGEMTAMFEKQAKPLLLKQSSSVLKSHNIHLFGIGESTVEDILKDYMQSHENPTVAPYAKLGEVLLRVTASALDERQATALLEPVVKEICDIFHDKVYGVDVGSLENALVTQLAQKGYTIATAESCTGGLVSKRITEVAGASNVFNYGVCTYSNDAKIKLLSVLPQTLEQFGAVSAQTAQEMAIGVRILGGATIGLSVTGIAGPGGGTVEKPVGLVYIGISTADSLEVVELKLGRGYGGQRSLIRQLAASNALSLALKAARATTH